MEQKIQKKKIYGSITLKPWILPKKIKEDFCTLWICTYLPKISIVKMHIFESLTSLIIGEKNEHIFILV